MKREPTFAQRLQPYAADLASFRKEETGCGSAWCHVDAVWFRRRRARYGPLQTVACAGDLRGLMRPEPATAEAYLLAHTDGAYGGNTLARWNGSDLWTIPGMSELERFRYLELLRPMLSAYPALPGQFDGWWFFERPGR